MPKASGSRVLAFLTRPRTLASLAIQCSGFQAEVPPPPFRKAKKWERYTQPPRHSVPFSAFSCLELRTVNWSILYFLSCEYYFDRAFDNAQAVSTIHFFPPRSSVASSDWNGALIIFRDRPGPRRPLLVDHGQNEERAASPRGPPLL